MIVGLDEAGVGPAFGSLWASAVYLPADIPGVGDSKTLTAPKRARLRDRILETASYGLGEVTAHEIDTYGLGEARRLVFERALDDLMVRFPDTQPSKLLVDGTLFRPWRNVPHECIPKADALYACVSAASILAKTTRDAQVEALCDAHPDLDASYGLRKNKGYLAAVHIQGLQQHGYSEHHRRSYRIRALGAT